MIASKEVSTQSRETKHNVAGFNNKNGINIHSYSNMKIPSDQGADRSHIPCLGCEDPHMRQLSLYEFAYPLLKTKIKSFKQNF